MEENEFKEHYEKNKLNWESMRKKDQEEEEQKL